MTPNAFPQSFTPTPNAMQRWGSRVLIRVLLLATAAYVLGAHLSGPASTHPTLGLSLTAIAWAGLGIALAVQVYGMGIEPMLQRKVQHDEVSQWVHALRTHGCSQATLVAALAEYGGPHRYPEGHAIARVLRDMGMADELVA